MKNNNHYDKKYWEWQKQSGKVGGILEKFKFEMFIDDDQTVLDFGCGGGFILSNLECAKKIGVEINENARFYAIENGIECYETLANIKDDEVDVVISNHALEHVENPAKIIKEIKRVLKPDGTVVCVVPCEQQHDPCFQYKQNNKDQHLYNWTPMTLANLFGFCGLSVVLAETIEHQFPPDFMNRYQEPLYHHECVKYAKQNKNLQIRVVAKK